MKQSFTPEEVNKIENDSFLIGMITGETKERNRIIDLLEDKQLQITLPDGTVHIEYNVLHDMIEAIKAGKE